MIGRREALRLAEFRAIAEAEAAAAESARERTMKIGYFSSTAVDATRRHDEAVYVEVFLQSPLLYLSKPFTVHNDYIIHNYINITFFS